MKIDVQETLHSFDIEKYCSQIIESIPIADTVGIKILRFVREFSNSMADQKSPACYLPKQGYSSAEIEVHIGNLVKTGGIPEYLFKDFHEIAALLLSEIVGHEIGHHVHEYKRHGLKKKESEAFAARYARAVYFNYLKQRQKQIMASYTRASRSILSFDRTGRKQFADSKKQLVHWLETNKKGVPFP